MDRYIDIDEKKLHNLHGSLEILEMLNREAMREFDLHLYGVTQNPAIIDAAKEAIADAASMELREEDVQLSEVAVAIPLSADTVYALGGSGIRLEREEFAYVGENEGPRTETFTYSHYKPKVALNEFTQLALASSTQYLDEFLQQYGNKQPAQIQKNIHRTEEATQPGVPAPVESPAVTPTTPQSVPKQTSRHKSKLTDMLEIFLG